MMSFLMHVIAVAALLGFGWYAKGKWGSVAALEQAAVDAVKKENKPAA